MPGRPGPERLVVGVAATPGYDSLPAVERECEQVAAWMKRHGIAPLCLRDTVATPAHVLARLPETALVHFAWHGDFDPEQPDRSGIMLSGVGTAHSLSIRELAQLHLEHCQHVAFTACLSGDSFILPALDHQVA